MNSSGTTAADVGREADHDSHNTTLAVVGSLGRCEFVTLCSTVSFAVVEDYIIVLTLTPKES